MNGHYTHNNLHEVNNSVLYFLYYEEDNLHRGPLCSRFNVVVSSSL
ncbi:unnamed protein product [Ascophyllum nodosum]